MICISTFFSHFGAMRCKKACDKAGISARMMPVPRMLSSSCGTCVRMEVDNTEDIPRSDETEQIALEQADGYRIIWSNPL
jgi:hypothetical protein